MAKKQTDRLRVEKVRGQGKNCTIGDVQNLLLNPRTHLSKKEFVTNYSSKHRKKNGIKFVQEVLPV